MITPPPMPPQADVGGVDEAFIRRRIEALQIAIEDQPNEFISRRIEALQIALQ